MIRSLQIILLLVFIVPSSLKAQEAIILDQNNKQVFAKGVNLNVFVDSSNNLVAEMALKELVNSNVRLDSEDLPSNVFSLDRNYWMYFEISDQDTSTNWYFLEVPDFHVNSIELYQVKSGAVNSLGKQGFFEHFLRRPLSYKNPTYIIQPKNADGYLIKLNSKFGSSYKVQISHPIAKFNYVTNEYLLLGLYYGILLALLFYNLFIFIEIRERANLLFVFFIGSCIWYSLFTDGLGFQFLWPILPEINQTFSATTVILMITFSFYSSHYLKLQDRNPVLRRFLWYSIYLSLLIYIVDFLIRPLHQFSSWFYVVPYVIIFLATLLQYRAGYRAARYFLTAFSIVMVCVFIHILMLRQIFPDNTIGVYSLNIGFVFGSIFLSLAQANKIKIENEEKLQSQVELIEQQEKNRVLQEKVNRELDQLVTKKTLQLKEKNEELEQRNQDLQNIHSMLEEMSIKLDIDNWKLKKEVASVEKHGILRSSLSVEEFQKVFPNNDSCLKFLADIKWSDGFLCKKCNNNKPSKGSTLIKKKCSKCNTVESATAGTLFHNLKFSLKDAFYIALITLKNSPITSKDLAKTLDLRESTCSTFRKKVSAKVDQVKPTNFDELLF